MEVKEKVEEFRRQKQELNEYIELEQFMAQEVEKELRQKQIKEEIEHFQQRVILKPKMKIKLQIRNIFFNEGL